ncbi:histidine triad nucleotide-binding protein 3 [Pristis pectinata]|uniref:histidine triad nucleotide-binding protein 3 n=1 Tax=Pristis pectinata TaxID=685728 RepID=UPI00223CB43E|nr:histidine triad nucleotide-binding protein 3 [Pristis pectinata]
MNETPSLSSRGEIDANRRSRSAIDPNRCSRSAANRVVMAAVAVEAPAGAETLVSASGDSEAPDAAGKESVSPTPAPAVTPVMSPTPAPTPVASGTPLPGVAPAPGEPEAPAPSPGPRSGPTAALAEGGGGFDKKCIFCKIGNKEEPADLVHWDEQFACFQDIRPGAPHHYLVVPRKHIGNCKSLKKEHISIVQAMVTIGKNVLLQKGIGDLSDARFGFHWPPFCTVAHLHLHVLAPASQMGFISRMIYRPNSYWFITDEQLIEKLKTLPEDSSGS